jgi:hypothetical protein
MEGLRIAPRVIDGEDDLLVNAIAAIIQRHQLLFPRTTEADVLDALAYAYACVQRFNEGAGTHPEELH